jgi:branched-chain amino acid transport system permease protein
MSTRRALWVGLVLLVLLALMPVDLTSIGLPYPGLRRYGTYILTLWLVTAIAAMGVNLIVGYAGQETLAQAAFVGIGAYLTAIATKAGVPFGVAFAASGLLTFVIGVALGFPALRVQKHYLAFVTLAFSVLCWLVFRNEQWITGGSWASATSSGRRVRPVAAQPRAFLLVRARHHRAPDLRAVVDRELAVGRAFTALRENRCAPKASASTSGSTLLAFALGSAYGGMAGSLTRRSSNHRPQPFALGPSLIFMRWW